MAVVPFGLVLIHSSAPVCGGHAMVVLDVIVLRHWGVLAQFAVVSVVAAPAVDRLVPVGSPRTVIVAPFVPFVPVGFLAGSLAGLAGLAAVAHVGSQCTCGLAAAAEG